MRIDLKTCRFCGCSNFERNHPAAKSHLFRYGARHSAHLKCYVERKGVEETRKLLAKLPTHRVAEMPFFELQELQLLDAARTAIGEVANVA